MDSNTNSKTKKAMTKDEVSLLLDLLQSKPIIISKETNASSNKLKEETGGGKQDFIPPDEVLERVAGLLGSTCTGFSVPFGGDGVGFTEEVVVLGGVGSDISSPMHKPIDDVVLEIATPEPTYIPTPISEAKKRKADGPLQPRCLYGMTSMSKELQTYKGQKQRYYVENGSREMNLAIQRYYEAKTIKVNLEIEKLKQELSNKTSQASTSTTDY